MRRSLAVLTAAGLLSTGIIPALVSPALADHRTGHPHPDPAPVVTDNSPPIIHPEVSGTRGDNDWYTSDVTITWRVTEPHSTVTSAPCSTVSITTDQAETTYTCSATSAGGTASRSVVVKRDATSPVVTLGGGPSGPVYEGEVAPAPTCTASDATPGSGLADADPNLVNAQPCVVSGYATSVGSHMVTASAKDLAGNAAVRAEQSYSVLDDVSAPTISPSVTGTLGGGDWYTSDVSVSFAVTESETPSSLQKTGCLSARITSDQDSLNYSCSASSLGGSAPMQTRAVKRDATAPTDVALSTGGPMNGATYTTATVPAAPTCTATDTRSGLARCEVGGYSTADGTHTLTATAYDIAGNWAIGTVTRTYNIVNDTTPPVITPTIVGTEGDNDWYTSNVKVTWVLTDGESAITSQTGCGEVNVITDQSSTTYTCSATSSGGTASVPVTVKRDATAPTVSAGQPTGTPGLDDWYTTDVTVPFTASDLGSGLLDATQASFNVTSSTTGSAVTIPSGTIKDNAGNTNSASVAVKIDKVDPTITAALDKGAATSGWFNASTGAPTVSYICTVGGSTIGACPASHTFAEGENQSHSGTVTAASGRSATAGVTNVDVDLTAPSISGSNIVNETWRNTDLSQSFIASDTTSGLATATDSAFTLTATAESTSATTPTTVSKTVGDTAGNTSTRSLSALIDRTLPTVSLVGAPANGSTVWTTQAAPTCSASDALSGLAGACTVTGFGTTVGNHTVTATAMDKAGNTATVSSTYTIRELTHAGFFQPVDMNGVYNTVKGGSTVPLKFTLAINGVNQSDLGLVTAFTSNVTSCSTSAQVDDVEIVTTGNTALRYESGQFIQNYKTASGAGTCYRATATLADGDKITALFKLK